VILRNAEVFVHLTVCKVRQGETIVFQKVNALKSDIKMKHYTCLYFLSPKLTVYEVRQM
jgi:hypothetical protein